MVKNRTLNDRLNIKCHRMAVIFFIEPDGNVTVSSLGGPALSIARALDPDDQRLKMLSSQNKEVRNVSLYDNQDTTYCG